MSGGSAAWKGLKHRDRWNWSWETPIMGHQLHPSPHWLHYVWLGYYFNTFWPQTCLCDGNFTDCMASCLQAICPEECGGYLWPGVGECSMLGGLREGCSMPHCSFSPQCQCRHKSHEFLQQYVSEAQNLQLIETKHTHFWEPFDPRLRDSCNMKML